METIGHVESLWRYPVKSMRGQEIAQIFLGFAGVYVFMVIDFMHSATRRPKKVFPS